MKNYTRPELTISLFDVEDVITASGVVSSNGYEDAVAEYGKLYTDSAMTTEAASTGNVVYFSWK